MPQLSKHLPWAISQTELLAISQTFTSAILQAYASWKKNPNDKNKQ